MARDAAASKIAAQLRTRIIQGDLVPGTRIVQEDVAAEFGVSRLPIREAFRSLESAGLVTLVASTGAWVSSLGTEESREVYLMRERLEPLLLGLSVPKHSPSSLADCAEALRAVSTAESNGDFLVADREFHRALMSRANSPRLQSMVDHLWNLTHYYRRLLLELHGIERRDDILDEHRMLLRAVEDGDVESAEALMAFHIRHTRQIIEQRPEIFVDG